MIECYNCGFWDSDREGCTCSSMDRWYACPIESERPENLKKLKELGESLEERTRREFEEDVAELERWIDRNE